MCGHAGCQPVAEAVSVRGSQSKSERGTSCVAEKRVESKLMQIKEGQQLLMTA
jgi:Na+-translocating ferredoxin:NAD+ oxidoreductase RNF subunit RnfB